MPCPTHDNARNRQAFRLDPAVGATPIAPAPGACPSLFLTLFLSLSLADLSRVRERVLHTLPNVFGNFDTVSARPRHERNLMYPYFPAHHRNGVAEGREGLWIPCGGSDLQFLGLGEIVRE